MNLNSTCDVHVMNGVENPEKDILSFETGQDGRYVFHCVWETEKSRLLPFTVPGNSET